MRKKNHWAIRSCLMCAKSKYFTPQKLIPEIRHSQRLYPNWSGYNSYIPKVLFDKYIKFIQIQPITFNVCLIKILCTLKTNSKNKILSNLTISPTH